MNYPFQLLPAPLIGAIAAGNCALLKPSNETQHTAHITGKIISDTFDEEYISYDGPGRSVGPLIIENNRFDSSHAGRNFRADHADPDLV